MLLIIIIFIQYIQYIHAYQIAITIDQTELFLTFDENDDPKQLAYNFCHKYNLIDAGEVNTGKNCIHSVETLILSQLPYRDRQYN